MTIIETQSERASFGGETGFYGRPYETCDGEPRFAVYTPPGAAGGPVPVLYCLDGLTSPEGTLMIKGGAQRLAAEHGLRLVAPATGPPTADVPGEDGFYVDATEGPWSRHHRMYSYVTLELPFVVEENFLPRRPRRLRPLHGRPRRARLRPEIPGPLPLRLGLGLYLRPPRVYPGARRPSSATSREQGDLEGQRRE